MPCLEQGILAAGGRVEGESERDEEEKGNRAIDSVLKLGYDLSNFQPVLCTGEHPIEYHAL